MSRPQGIWNGEPKRQRPPRSPRRPSQWIRISSQMHEHPDITGLRSDTTRWAWLVVLCEAKAQPEPGEFRSEEHLRQALGWRLSRSIPALVAAGLLERVVIDARTTRVKVHNWSRWQSAAGLDRTAAERQQRHREREKAAVTALRNGVTPEDVSRVTNGGPPLQGLDNAPVTRPTGEAAVTVQREDESGDPLAQRRRLARAIREASHPSLKRRYETSFLKLYGHLYAREAVQ